MSSASLFIKGIFIVLTITLALTPVIVFAEDTDPSGAQLKALRDDPKFKAEAAKRSQGSIVQDDQWEWLCAFETANPIGMGVWKARQKREQCKDASDRSTKKYCALYSRYCGIDQWDSGCLLQRLGKDQCDK